MVPEQWKMVTTWVRGLEAAGVCESDRRHGNIRMGGRADKLEVAAESGGSFPLACLSVGSDSGGSYLTTCALSPWPDHHLVG